MVQRDDAAVASADEAETVIPIGRGLRVAGRVALKRLQSRGADKRAVRRAPLLVAEVAEQLVLHKG